MSSNSLTPSVVPPSHPLAAVFTPNRKESYGTSAVTVVNVNPRRYEPKKSLAKLLPRTDGAVSLAFPASQLPDFAGAQDLQLIIVVNWSALSRVVSVVSSLRRLGTRPRYAV